MAITLGKDATVSAGGSIVGVRNVTFSSSARTIDIEEYGIRYASVYSTGRDGSLSMEVNDGQSLSGLFASLNNGTEITVSGGVGTWSFPAVVTSINENAAIDGVVTFTVEAKLTKSGLKA